MRICLFAVALVAALIARAGAEEIVPTDADRAAFTRGVTLERAVNVFQHPQMCGIVLLRDACAASIEALFAKTPSDPKAARTVASMMAFAKSGDRARYDKEWGQINSLGFAEGLPWSADARGVWLESAGSAYVFESDISNYAHELFNQERLSALARYAPDAGPYASLVPSVYTIATKASVGAPHGAAKAGARTVGLDPDKGAKFSALLMPELSELFPQASFAVVNVGSTAGGAERLGIYMATANELFESSTIALDPSGRAFLSQLAAAQSQLGVVPKGLTFAELQSIYATSRDPEKIKAAVRVQAQLNDDTISILPSSRKGMAIAGLYVTQAAYNAAFLQEMPFDRDVRGFLEKVRGTNTPTPELAAFLATKPGDWPAENAALTNLVHVLYAVP